MKSRSDPRRRAVAAPLIARCALAAAGCGNDITAPETPVASAGEHRYRRRDLADDRARPAPTRFAVPAPAAVDLRGIPRGARRDRGRAGGSSPRSSATRSTIGARAACCAGTRSCASWWPATTCPRRRARTAPTRSRRREPVRGSAVSLLEPALRRARVQLRERRAVRGAEGGLVLQVPVPAGPRRRRWTPPSTRSCPPATCPPIRPRTPCSPASPRSCCARCSRPPWRRSRPGRPSSATRRCGRAAPRRATSRPASPSAARSPPRLMARAGADGMRNAIGNAAQWQACADAATARGETPWKSLETAAAAADAARSSARCGPG